MVAWWDFKLVTTFILVCSIQPQHCREDEQVLEAELQGILNKLESKLEVKNVMVAGSVKTGNVTVLSALSDIGYLPGTDIVTEKNPLLYLKWMEIFKAVRNPLVFFTDKYSTAESIMNIRTQQEYSTVVVLYEKHSSWSFQLVTKLSEIFNSDMYPRHYPNTVVPEYACVTHAKFEFMHIVSLWNPFQTKASAWVDIGLYKEVANKRDFRPFKINMLPSFDHRKVMLNYIREPKPYELNHRYIMIYSVSMFSGAFWIGNMDSLTNLTVEYKNHLEILLDEGLANCEEQVLASMFVEGTQFRPSVEIQKFKAWTFEGCDRWYCLGHKTRHAGLLIK